MAKEPIYIPYGDNEIELSALMTAIADNASNYVSSLPWSNKRKEKFLSAYQDIISKGIKGASNSSGQWALDLNEDIDLDSKSKKDLEMYHEAAYYILNLMQGLPTRQVVEEKAKNNLQLYNNDWHKKAFEGYIGNKMFGGQNWDYTKDWDTLDTRDSKTGILSTSRRMAKLAEMLEGYGNSLEENKYNFEGTAFKDLNDLKTRIGNAVNSLRSGVLDLNVKDSLNAVGLDWREFLRDGSEEVVGTDNNGNPITRAQAIEAQSLAQQEADAQKAAQEQQLALAKQKANAGVLNLIGGIHAVEARSAAPAYADYLSRQYGVGLLGYLAINNTVQGLLEKGRIGQLSSREKKQLGNLLYYIRTNNPNYKNSNISDAEWAELNKHSNLKSLNRNGFVRLPWQISGRYTFADDKGNIYYLKPLNQLKLGEIKINRNNINNYKNNFLKSLLQLNNEKPVLSLDTDILVSDVTSMLGDIISLGGGYIGAAGGITTLLSDLYGDIRRGKDTWSTIKNLGANIAWGAAGLIPGAKLGKLAKTATRIYATLQSAGILMNDDVQLSWKNLIAGKPITARDFENFKWTLHAVTGGTNAVRGHFTERNVAKQVKSNNKPTIETKSGKKVTLTEDLVRKINKVGGRKGQKAAEEAFKKSTGEEAKEGTFSFLENARAWYNPNRYSQRLRNWTSDNERLILPKTTNTINLQAVNKLLEIDKSKPVIGFGNPFNKRFWTEGGPNRGGLTWAVSPYRINQYDKLLQNSNSESSNVSKVKDLTPEQYRASQVGRKLANIKIREEFPENVKFNRETISNYKNIMNNNFSTNKLQSGSSKLAGNSLQVVELSDGTFNVIFKGKIVANERNLIEILKSIRDLIKNAVLLNKSTKSSKISAKEMGKLLKQFKAKGWLKQGGQIQPNIETQIANFLRKR